MDTGVYGSYPRTKYSRGRNYRFGKSLRRKGYKRRNFISNPYTFKKTRIGRYTKTDMQSVKCTYTDAVVIRNATGASYTFLLSGTVPYVNLAAILAGSPEFQSRATQYSYYMLNGMSVGFTRRWIDPIALGTVGGDPGILKASYTFGFEMMSCNFYPNLINTTVGSPTEQADSSWDVSPYITTKQSHYQPFPKNFTTGTNSNGLGVWNACSQSANIQGELSIYNDGFGITVSDTAAFFVWDMEINLYTSFCNNTGA